MCLFYYRLGIIIILLQLHLSNNIDCQYKEDYLQMNCYEKLLLKKHETWTGVRINQPEIILICGIHGNKSSINYKTCENITTMFL